MRKLLGCLLLSWGLATGSAHAEGGDAKLYLGAGFSDGSVDVVEGGFKSLGTVTAVVGLQFLDYLGLEFSTAAGSDQSSSVFSEPLVNYQAVLLRLGYRWDRVGVYALVGQARLDIDEELNSSDAGNVYGFGLNLFGNETTSLNFNMLDIDDGTFRAATIGFQYYFGGYR